MISGPQTMPTVPCEVIHELITVSVFNCCSSPETLLWAYVGWWSNRHEPFFVQQSPLFPALLDPLACHNSWKLRPDSQSLPDLLQLTLLVHNDVCHSLIVQFLRQKTTSKTKTPQHCFLASLHIFSYFTRADILVVAIKL